MLKSTYEEAKKYIGVKEVKGRGANPTILGFYKRAGVPMGSDEVPWCAAFVNAILVDCGYRGTRSLTARSLLGFGHAVELEDARPGDIVVFWRGRKGGWQGHVGFYAGNSGKRILVLGGNQSNAVNIRPYSTDRLLGIRRPANGDSIARSQTMQASGTGVASVAAISGVVTATGSLSWGAQMLVWGMALAGLAALCWIGRKRIARMIEEGF